ncbi:hypothetical protein [Devosia geojensis]|uniref:hypothetical protein n=1 Tax=Devosia geojensis TaxID=443610 RepID=UPI000B2EFB6F|nr:hypothetical protein [Devosia geojensis]
MSFKIFAPFAALLFLALAACGDAPPGDAGGAPPADAPPADPAAPATPPASP